MNGNRIGLGEVVKTWLGHQIAPYMRYLGKNERPNRLLDKIEQAAASLNRKDIDSWVKARQRALNVEAPRRDLLIKLFEDVKLDPHISGVIEHGRVNRLLAMDFRVLDAKSGKDEEELTQLLNSSWFHQFIKLSLESIWFGHSLIEFDTIEADRVVGLNVIPRAHIVPEFGVYLEKPSDSEGIAYRDTPLMDYMVEIGESHDLGVLLKAAPWYLYKKNATIAWSPSCSECPCASVKPIQSKKARSTAWKPCFAKWVQRLTECSSMTKKLSSSNRNAETRSMCTTSCWSVPTPSFQSCFSDKQ